MTSTSKIIRCFINFHSIFRFHQISLFFVFVLLVETRGVHNLALFGDVGVSDLSAQDLFVLFDYLPDVHHVKTVGVLREGCVPRECLVLRVRAGARQRHLAHIFPVQTQSDKHCRDDLNLDLICLVAHVDRVQGVPAERLDMLLVLHVFLYEEGGTEVV